MKTPSNEYLREKTWEEKAQENPLYGVMSHEEFIDSGSQPSEEELKAFYNRGREMVSMWIEPWLRESNTTKEMRILEFGCGMGRLTNALAENHQPGNVFGIDISKTMISHATRNTADGCNYSIVGDKGDFPYEDRFFDRVYSYAVFQHISQKSVVEKSISEIARVLKADGRVKLNFEMSFSPPFENALRQDTRAFESNYLLYGWTKIYGIPVWGIKSRQADNWTGIRLGYVQLVNYFRKNGIEIHGIVREPGKKRHVWFLGKKSIDN